MSRVTVVQPIHTTPTAAWALLGDPAAFAGWHPAIASSETSGENRVCVLPDGARIEERILSHDDGAMRYRYAITGGPLPVQGYESTLAVEPSGDGCVVRWTCDFESPAPAEEIDGMIRGLYEAGLQAARERLEA